MPTNFTIRKRKSRIAKSDSKNPNYALLREKLVRKRANRQLKRVSAKKASLALPLTMVDGVQQRRAMGEGKLLLMNGETPIEIPLEVKQYSGEKSYLQGVYKLADGKLAVLRSVLFFDKPVLKYYLRENGQERYVESFFNKGEDIAHMFLNDPALKGKGLGIRAAVKSEKEYRAIGGKQPVVVDGKLTQVYKKMHYTQIGNNPRNMQKTGRAYMRDNMKRNHVIEAIDPVTGKQRTYSFHIENGGV